MAVTETISREAEETGRVRAKKYGRVRVFGKWCKGCGLCIAFCPRGVFSENEQHHPVVAHGERCVACQWCSTHCPDFAIVVEPVDEPVSGTGK